jgi:hypothetical protein
MKAQAHLVPTSIGLLAGLLIAVGLLPLQVLAGLASRSEPLGTLDPGSTSGDVAVRLAIEPLQSGLSPVILWQADPGAVHDAEDWRVTRLVSLEQLNWVPFPWLPHRGDDAPATGDGAGLHSCHGDSSRADLYLAP